MRLDSPSREPPSEWEKFLSSKAYVLVVLFTVTAALGLPLLWWSPAFQTAERWFWAFVILTYTALLIVITLAIFWWAYDRLQMLI
jgi:ABC-type multidrug transport system permease subunit